MLGYGRQYSTLFLKVCPLSALAEGDIRTRSQFRQPVGALFLFLPVLRAHAHGYCSFIPSGDFLMETHKAEPILMDDSRRAWDAGQALNQKEALRAISFKNKRQKT